MTLHEYPDIEQGTEEWLALRRGMVTASVIGKLITPKTIKVANNDDVRTLTALLVAERITGWSDPTFVSNDMARGHDVEPIARGWYAETHAPVVEMGYMVREFANGHRLGYSPDGLVGDDGLLEIKAPRAKAHLMTHVEQKMPLMHMAQVQTGLLVSGRDWCQFISFYCGMPPFMTRIERDDRWAEVIVEAVDQFETRAAEIQAEYETATTGLPQTERLLIDMEMVI